ncbi:hypothetical protein [Holdemania massiliensis]|uniref:hypothetical protein n=1 Tax=Holdemania massiliensis TaxID=1468449 RepID=UPI001F06D53A|nr:hypothetical protein [Holdemania massiliensis]MCH1939510.1 hypothetical protein [Holdemania massiliensis]
MKKLSLLLLALILISTAACSSQESKNPQPETTPEATAEPVALKDGTYDGYDMQSPYVAKATVTIEGGKAVSYEFEECHLPNFWATLTEEEAEKLGEEEAMAVTVGTGTSYYARHVLLGSGDDTIKLTVLEDPWVAPNGSTYIEYGNDEIASFSEYVENDENAAWYFDQILAGNYWIADKDWNLMEDMSAYTMTRKDGVVLDKVDSRLKTKIMHWTAVGTGVGTEMGNNGWTGNLKILGDTLIELQFPDGEIAKNENNQVMIGDVVTSATIEQYEGYLDMFYEAYNKAKQ